MLFCVQLMPFCDAVLTCFWPLELKCFVDWDGHCHVYMASSAISKSAIRLVTPFLSNLFLSCLSVSLRVLPLSGSSYRTPCCRFSSLALFFGSPDATVLSITFPLKSSRQWYFFTSPFLLSNLLPALTSAFSSQHFPLLPVSTCYPSQFCVHFPALHQLCHASVSSSHFTPHLVLPEQAIRTLWSFLEVMRSICSSMMAKEPCSSSSRDRIR